MPRNHISGTSTLRNRNRVTNKTRLKVINGNIDGDAIVLDEDEEKARVVSTAGVDAEDANEHHLQAVLSAASQRNQPNGNRSTRGAEKTKDAPAAFIPIPDSTGIVEGYEELYPSGRWTDPHNYVKTSETVEESCTNALANGFTYYMDERDKEWLDKNNEEARGEGTSVQGSVSSNGATTRSGWTQRSAKSKGKEPDVPQPLTITEDQFELVMGIFEKVTHDKTEYLHHGLEQGMAFPPFSDYQETFSSPLPPPFFAAFAVPQWTPPPQNLLSLAKAIYPYWKERRLERGGHRIIPVLNLDEADVKNESYICFRRRELKAVRKTRTSQVSYSDKLMRLQTELLSSLELAKEVIDRENVKRATIKVGQGVWEKRMAFVDLKRKYPMMGAPEDFELLHDKERVPKRPRTDSTATRLSASIKIRTRESGDLGSPSPHAEVMMKPRERFANINRQIELHLSEKKERDHHWEDMVENPYQPMPIPYAQRFYKPIPPFESVAKEQSTDEDDTLPSCRSVRMRRGRGGRLFLDRHSDVRSSRLSMGRREMRGKHAITVDEDASPDDRERAWRLSDRWQFDDDDGPAVGLEGAEERDRVLVDEWDAKYLRQTMTLLHDLDHQNLNTDASIVVTAPDGRQSAFLPFRLGPSPTMRRDLMQRQMAPPIAALHHAMTANGTPISMQSLKMMQPPAVVPQMRISSNGGLRPTNHPGMPSVQSNAVPQQSSPPRPPPPQVNGTNGASPSPIPSSENEVQKPATPVTIPVSDSALQPAHTSQVEVVAASPELPASIPLTSSPMRPPPQPQPQPQPHAITIPNGFHVPAVNGYPTLPNGSPYMHLTNGHHNALSLQQMQNIKSAFAAQAGQEFMVSANGGNMQPRPGPYMGHVVPGANFNLPLGNMAMNLKLPAQRQMQWSSHPQRPPSVNGVGMNGMDGTLVNGSMSSPSLAHAVAGVPARAPSANGVRGGVTMMARPPSVGQGSPPNTHLPHLMAHSMSPHLHNTASPQMQTMQTTPPRPTQPPMTSPSMQQQQIQHVQQMVGGPGNGY
ncbi:hypothetical protein JAAARDRAFT_137127 [Jaapia argillacea MUCL 33604]|uniref:Enhancer of polycomb-like protein n=1 Tax=Jaapia argillacea MUCL 33604 TaxID=933084 RepID=A0A067PEQ9_9AGAM|nr:hypothetical protein JAAARDRAFT_137127 [Jaapia argillacea MUCL 33604]